MLVAQAVIPLRLLWPVQLALLANFKEALDKQVAVLAALVLTRQEVLFLAIYVDLVAPR